MGATSEPVNRSARAGIETTALEIGTGSQRSAIIATTFHEMLRPAACFLRTRTALPIISRKVSANRIAAYHSGATASVQSLAQLLPSQMSEPWHVSKLLVPLPLRYAAVVPAQNASGCPMPRHTVPMSLLAGIERHKAKTTAYSTDKHATNPARRRIPARCAILAVNERAGPH